MAPRVAARELSQVLIGLHMLAWQSLLRNHPLLPEFRRQPAHESDAVHRQARLAAVSTRWTLLGLDEEIIERARRPFPSEPVRTLDAIHLASALTARKAVSELAMLSLDGRVRRAADSLGFVLMPSDAELGL